MNYAVWTYAVYAAAAIGLTGVLARTLFRNGEVFLAAVFEDDQPMAKAINHLLVIGFYMLNLGYAFLLFRTNGAATALDATEHLVTRLGMLLVSLGVIHFVNMFVFWLIKKNGDATKKNAARANRYAATPPPPAPGAATSGMAM